MNAEGHNRFATDLWAPPQLGQNQSGYSGIRHSAGYTECGIAGTRLGLC
jgi:hypothetical protein